MAQRRSTTESGLQPCCTSPTLYHQPCDSLKRWYASKLRVKSALCHMLCSACIWFGPDLRWERVRTSKGEEVSRPVVRMEIDGRPLIFTRINPDSKSTSVLVRPRPNWRLLKDYLSGFEDVRQGLTRKQRSVCEIGFCGRNHKVYASRLMSCQINHMQ